MSKGKHGSPGAPHLTAFMFDSDRVWSMARDLIERKSPSSLVASPGRNSLILLKEDAGRIKGLLLEEDISWSEVAVVAMASIPAEQRDRIRSEGRGTSISKKMQDREWLIGEIDRLERRLQH
jgi:hypothetical protein